MDALAINRVIELLENAPDFFVPVKKLWLMLQGEGLALDIGLEDFHHALLANDQFEFTPGVDHEAGFEAPAAIAEEMAQEMENLGFYSGPRVKLASRTMKPEDIFVAMSRSLTRMNEALRSAWDARPKGDQEVEDQMLEILAAGQRLEREIKEIISQPEQDEE